MIKQKQGSPSYDEQFIKDMATRLKEKGTTNLKAASLSDPMMMLTDPTLAGWTKLTSNPTRELVSITQERMIEISYWLWKTNPLANWIIEIMTSFIVGDGLRLEAQNTVVQDVLDKFWNHPINNLPIYLEKHVRELGIYGEQCWPKFVSQYTGKVALGYADPISVKKVITDPENCKIAIAVITKGSDFRDGKKYKTVIDPDVEEFLSRDAIAIRESCERECYFFAINNVSNDPRGTSDLFVTADWLDAYEQFLFDYSDKWPQLNSFVWDLLVEGGDDEEIKKQLKNFTKKSGSSFGHNEKVKLTAVTPDLQSVAAKEGASLIRNHIMGTKSLPEIWYGGGGDSNRAAALEMGAPVFKMLSSRQKQVIYILQFVGNDVLREADAHGMLKGVPDDERKFSVNAAELATKDIGKFATAVQQLTTSLVAAQTQEWIDSDTAVKIFAFAIALIGFEIDVEAVKNAMAKERETKGYEDYTKGKPTTTEGAPNAG